METQEATRELGWVLKFGQPDDRGSGLIDLARHYGREWQWGEAGRELIRAYHLLGAEQPAVGDGSEVAHGTAWHRGHHPIQEACRHLSDDDLRRIIDNKGYTPAAGRVAGI